MSVEGAVKGFSIFAEGLLKGEQSLAGAMGDLQRWGKGMQESCESGLTSGICSTACWMAGKETQRMFWWKCFKAQVTGRQPAGLGGDTPIANQDSDSHEEAWVGGKGGVGPKWTHGPDPTADMRGGRPSTSERRSSMPQRASSERYQVKYTSGSAKPEAKPEAKPDARVKPSVWNALVGSKVNTAAAVISRDRPELQVIVVDADAMVTMDVDETRVRIFAKDGMVTRAPRVG
jgi:hypothetical protein